MLPSPGRLVRYVEPVLEHVRTDTGVRQGSEVSIYYDPLLAKVIARADTRTAVIERMRNTLSDFDIHGVKTNIPLHMRVLDSQAFREGTYDTGLLTNL
jgi:acetyl-CoA carboxylase, biotin carboxylase subunit